MRQSAVPACHEAAKFSAGAAAVTSFSVDTGEDDVGQLCGPIFSLSLCCPMLHCNETVSQSCMERPKPVPLQLL
jgi:hypothetical protein